jgi:hypothetical protein
MNDFTFEKGESVVNSSKSVVTDGESVVIRFKSCNNPIQAIESIPTRWLSF